MRGRKEVGGGRGRWMAWMEGSKNARLQPKYPALTLGPT